MHIVCPHCTTSYAVNPATFGAAGRTVRCARCKETWLAVPEDLARAQAVPATAAAGDPDPNEDMSAWGVSDDDPADDDQQDAPLIDSPSISSDMPSETEDSDWPAQARDEDDFEAEKPPAFRRSWLPRLHAPAWLSRLPLPRIPFLPKIRLGTACVGMAALVAALMIWRVEVVRLLPQTASFYALAGIDVNLRGFAFKDVKITTETVDGKPVLVIEGAIVSESRKPLELPRLRFVVRDAQGTEIYAWNTKLEQPGLNPGDQTKFRSRLASPPAEGRNIDVRFFNKRDLAAGSA